MPLLRSRALSLVFALGFMIVLHAQQATPPAKQKTAAEAFKNIQVLKDVPENRWFTTMSFFDDSLGVTCSHCHERPFEADVKPAKATARKMITMVREINEKLLPGTPGVTCYTCHRGNTAPAITPVPDFDHWVRASTPETPLPQAADLINKYKAATGLAEGLQSHTQTATLQVTTYLGNPAGPATVSEEVVIGSSDKSRMSVRGTDGQTTFAKNGDKNWAAEGSAIREMTKQEQRNLANEVSVLDLDLIGPVTGPKTLRKERVYNHEAYVVEGMQEKTRVWLFFDVQSGFLLRQRVFFPTYFAADANYDVEFDDYQRVAKVMLPFTVRVINPGGSGAVLREIKKRDLDPRIEPGMFDAPSH